jgi:HK97 gp10 family phage protein
MAYLQMANNDLAAFQRRMKHLRRGIRETVGPAVEKGGDEFVATAKRLAPVEDGNLRDSIRAEDKTDLGVTVKAGGPATTRNTTKYPYDYALGVEFGTQKSPAQPYFYPAYRLVKKRVTGRIRRALGQALKETFSGN